MMEPQTQPTHAPKEDPISVEELQQHDGSDKEKPVWVAIKGKVFDVTPRREMYGQYACERDAESMRAPCASDGRLTL